jgi:hypothetical protein
MADENHKRVNPSWPGIESENDELDRQLDEVLRAYATVEPRPGIEERILANLQAGQEREVARSWWRWSAIGLMTTVTIALIVSLALRSVKSAPDTSAHRTASSTPASEQAVARVAPHDEGEPHLAGATTTAMRSAKREVRHRETASNEPRLAQFPSLRPLSNEEQRILRYVQEFPEEALMVAQRQAEFEKEAETPSENHDVDPNPDQDNQQEDRPER